jgi:hypothetical protein
VPTAARSLRPLSRRAIAPVVVRFAALFAVLIAVLFVAALAGCGHEVERHEDEPFDDRENEMFQGIYDCTERSDTGYRNGNSFPIKVVTADAKPVEVKTANAYIAMQSRARQAGVNLRIVSGFRTQAQQQYLYGCYVNCNCNNCNLAARPGYSNHQSGHALDLNTSDSGVLTWLNNNAASFGFARTVPSEPWHWEYWGAVSFAGPCGGPPVPRECETGNFDGAFCDDDGQSSEVAHDRLKTELGVNFQCAAIAGEPAFCPRKEATRAQAMFVLGQAARIPLAGHPDAFVDDNGHPRERWLNAAKAFGIMVGTDGGTRVKPDDLVTRSTLAVILKRMYRLPPADRDYFDDDDGSSNEDAHNRAAAAGLISGYADADGGRRDFRGSARATRATLAVLAVRARDRGLVPVWDIPQPCLDGRFSGAFCDDDGTAAEAAHDRLASEFGLDVRRGQLAGSPTFLPAERASRAESVYILGGAAGMPTGGHPNGFVDDNGHPRERSLNAAKAFGIVTGYSGGTEVRPDVIATRTTAAIILSRMYALPAPSQDYFTDDNGTSAEAWHNKVGAAGLFTGYADGNGGRAFRGDRPVTRTNLATLAGRAADAGLRPVWAPAPAPVPPPEEPPEEPGADEPIEDPNDLDPSVLVPDDDLDDPEPAEEELGPPLDDEGALEGPPEGLEPVGPLPPPSVTGGCSAGGAAHGLSFAMLFLALSGRARPSCARLRRARRPG